MMDEKDFDSVLAGMRDVRDYVAGKRDGFVVHAPADVDVRSIRKANRLTQEGFARTYGFRTSTVRDWEQGRRRPEGAARILLAMIAREPETVQRVLRSL
jgi:putative transcriptional regulator